jgi:hypothetical protein
LQAAPAAALTPDLFAAALDAAAEMIGRDRDLARTRHVVSSRR